MHSFRRETLRTIVTRSILYIRSQLIPRLNRSSAVYAVWKANCVDKYCSDCRTSVAGCAKQSTVLFQRLECISISCGDSIK